MKRRIAIWAGIGVLVACSWILYSFVMSPEYLQRSMREPVVQALVVISCPIAFAGRYVPLSFWWLPPINAATYTLIGLILEILRRKSNPRVAV